MLSLFGGAGDLLSKELMAIEKVLVMVFAEEDESLTWIVKLKVPKVVGVPEITPVAPFNVNPVGRDPELIFQLYGLVPPVACKVCE